MDDLHTPFPATPNGVTPAELAELRQQPDARLLDVRPAADFERRHLPGSVSIPADELEARTPELPPRRRLLLVAAATADEARRQAERLRARGWRRSVPLLAPADVGAGPWEAGPSRGALWEPTPIVAQWAERIPPGPVCDLGCGSGRDAVYLAQRGHAVTAIDRLPDALAMAASLARRHDVTLRTLALDLRREPPPPAEPAAGHGYAAILMIRFLQRELLRWVVDALRGDGLFLLETYVAETPATRRLRPHEARDAFAAAAMASDAPARWEILESREGPDDAGKAVARLVARREA